MKEMTENTCDIITASCCWNCNKSTVAISDRGAYVVYCKELEKFFIDEDILYKGGKAPDCFKMDTEYEENDIICGYMAMLELEKEKKRKEVVYKLKTEFKEGHFYSQDFHKTLEVVEEIYGNEIQDREFLVRKLNCTIVFFSEEELKQYLINNGYVGKTTFEVMIEWVPDKDKLKFYEKEFNIKKAEKSNVYYQLI